MKMKKLLATALILLMSMMACVPAFAEGWPNTITETIDCTGFTKNETGKGWEWDHKTKTLKITGDLLIKITQKKETITTASYCRARLRWILMEKSFTWPLYLMAQPMVTEIAYTALVR